MQRQLLLENRALSLSNGDSNHNGVQDVPEPAPASQDIRHEDAVGEMYQSSERRVILEALAKTRWNRRKAARLLGISYNTLRRRIDRYHLNSTYPL